MTPANRRLPRAPRPPPADSSPGSAPPSGPSKVASVLAGIRVGSGVALVLAASLGLGWGVRRYVTGSPRFAVASVQVAGAERRSAAAVADESGIAIGTNIFAIDLDGARAAILADPWIEEATLTRHLPETVEVRVHERRAAALVALGDTLLAAPDGEPFKKLEPGDPFDLPLITGLTPDGVAGDREEARRLIRRGIDLAAEYAQAPLSKRAPLQEVHVDTSGAFTLVVGRPPIDLVLGEPPFRRKLDQAARVFAELDRRRAKAQAIMVDNEARPERVVARLR